MPRVGLHAGRHTITGRGIMGTMRHLAGAVLGAVGVQGLGATVQYGSVGPPNLSAEHLALIIVPLALTCCVLGFYAILGCTRTVRITTLLVVGACSALIAVGTASWCATYIVTRDVILERAEGFTSAAAERAVLLASGEVSVGIGIMKAVQLFAARGHFGVDQSWPESHFHLDRLMRTVGRDSASMTLIFVGSQSGRFMGITPDGSVQFTTSEIPGSLPEWLRCPPRDTHLRCNTGSTVSACTDTTGTLYQECGESCNATEAAASYCAEALVSFVVAMPTTNMSDLAFLPVMETAASVTPRNIFDPRVRPWYVQSAEPTWSSPYLFAGGSAAIGLTASVGLHFDGAFVGSLGVDYSFSSINAFMSDVKPSDNGVAFLMTSDGLLVGSSMADVELAQDTGVVEYDTIDAVNILKYRKTESESKIVRAVGAVRSKWGTVEAAAVGSSMYQYSDDVVVSYPIKLQGLTMLLVVSVPMSDIMGKADHASTLSLVMTVSISVGLALLAAVGLKVALLPLENLQQNMYDVACMNVEGHEDGVSSHLTEIRSMQESFSTMVKNLIEYKQYLPQSVLVDVSEKCEDSPRSRRSSRISFQHRKNRLSLASSNLEASARSSYTDLPAIFHADTTARFREVSLLLTNISSFVDTLKCDTVAASALHTTYLEKMVSCVNGHRGIIDEFIGDKVHASFNTVQASATHRTLVAECMVAIRTRLFKDAPVLHAKVNAAAVSTRAMCGALGCKGLKKYTIVGPCASLVWVMERWGRAWGVPALIDAQIAYDGAMRFSMCCVAKTRISTQRDEFVHEIFGERTVDVQEWMYQVESSSANNEYASYNQAFRLLYDGDYDAADLAVQNAPKKTKQLAALSDWIERCRERGAPPSVVPSRHMPEIDAVLPERAYAMIAAPVVSPRGDVPV